MVPWGDGGLHRWITLLCLDGRFPASPSMALDYRITVGEISVPRLCRFGNSCLRPVYCRIATKSASMNPTATVRKDEKIASAQRANTSPSGTVGPLGRRANDNDSIRLPRALPWAGRTGGPSAHNRRFMSVSCDIFKRIRRYKCLHTSHAKRRRLGLPLIIPGCANEQDGFVIGVVCFVLGCILTGSMVYATCRAVSEAYSSTSENRNHPGQSAVHWTRIQPTLNLLGGIGISSAALGAIVGISAAVASFRIRKPQYVSHSTTSNSNGSS